MGSHLLPIVLAVLCGGGLVVAQGVPDISGTWRLNADASDAPGTIGAGDDGSSVGGRAPLGGFGMPGRQPLGGFGSPGAMPPPVVSPEVRKQRAELMRELLQPIRRMTIAEDGGVVSFTYEDGRTVRYRTNGKAEKHQAINGVVETETRWKKGRLVRETNLDDGMSIEETFWTEPPGVLVVELETSGGPGRRKPVRRVYDPVE